MNSNLLANTSILKEQFTDLEIFAALFAAATHDVGHTGFSNQYLVSIEHEIATRYNDQSVQVQSTGLVYYLFLALLRHRSYQFPARLPNLVGEYACCIGLRTSEG